MRALQAAGRLPVTARTRRPRRDVARPDARPRRRGSIAKSSRRRSSACGRTRWSRSASDLRMWLDQSASGAGASGSRIAFELAFGLPRRSRTTTRAASREEVTLPEGGAGCAASSTWSSAGAERAGPARHRLQDGRATAPRRNLVVGGGEMLQPVLYGLAVEQLLAASVCRVAPLLLHARRRLLRARRADDRRARARRGPRGARADRSRDRARLPAGRRRASARARSATSATCAGPWRRRASRRRTSARSTRCATLRELAVSRLVDHGRARAHPHVARRDAGRRGGGGHRQDERAGRAPGERARRGARDRADGRRRSRSPRRRRAS